MCHGFFLYYSTRVYIPVRFMSRCKIHYKTLDFIKMVPLKRYRKYNVKHLNIRIEQYQLQMKTKMATLFKYVTFLIKHQFINANKVRSNVQFEVEETNGLVTGIGLMTDDFNTRKQIRCLSHTIGRLGISTMQRLVASSNLFVYHQFNIGWSCWSDCQ